MCTQTLPKRLQADVLSVFHTLGLSFLLLTMRTQTLPKRLQADVFERFSYFGVKLLAACHAHTDTPKTSAGRRFSKIVLQTAKIGRSAGLLPLMATEAGRHKGASLRTQ